ncbi:hypothetical protein PSI17_08050, partial [Xenorhabdus sp. IM139775]|nr:hypothetical protein [Xenorhabdus sp. IM139775]
MGKIHSFDRKNGFCHNISKQSEKTLGDFYFADCNENVCVMLDKFYQNIDMWINLCIYRYKAAFCCVMQQT